MAETAAYCSECYNKALKSGSADDAAIQAAEQAGSVPMTKQGACSRCGKQTVVLYYQT